MNKESIIRRSLAIATTTALVGGVAIESNDSIPNNNLEAASALIEDFDTDLERQDRHRHEIQDIALKIEEASSFSEAELIIDQLADATGIPFVLADINTMDTEMYQHFGHGYYADDDFGHNNPTTPTALSDFARNFADIPRDSFSDAQINKVLIIKNAHDALDKNPDGNEVAGYYMDDTRTIVTSARFSTFIHEVGHALADPLFIPHQVGEGKLDTHPCSLEDDFNEISGKLYGTEFRDAYRDEFVSAYAATKATEDIAETIEEIAVGSAEFEFESDLKLKYRLGEACLSYSAPELLESMLRRAVEQQSP